VLVQAGDSVTVSLSQVNPDLWDISLQDNTSGQGFNVQEAYSGSASSADWITEAPTSNYVDPFGCSDLKDLLANGYSVTYTGT